MIEPTKNDIGRSVVYRPPGREDVQGENVAISSFNVRYVHVKYGGQLQSKATNRHDLFWLMESDRV